MQTNQTVVARLIPSYWFSQLTPFLTTLQNQHVQFPPLFTLGLLKWLVNVTAIFTQASVFFSFFLTNFRSSTFSPRFLVCVKLNELHWIWVHKCVSLSMVIFMDPVEMAVFFSCPGTFTEETFSFHSSKIFISLSCSFLCFVCKGSAAWSQMSLFSLQERGEMDPAVWNRWKSVADKKNNFCMDCYIFKHKGKFERKLNPFFLFEFLQRSSPEQTC